MALVTRDAVASAAAAVMWIELGRIGAPYGVKGWVHIDSHTDPPEGLLNYAQWNLRFGTGMRVTRAVAESRSHGDKFVARLEGCEDRNAAVALTGATIEIERANLPPTRAREHYRADLIGLKVQTVSGAELGCVRHFVDAPTGPLMVVRDEAGREHWIPAVPEYLRKVDLQAGAIQVDWPAELE
jgi:16S rRNA processing protein RimM